MTAEHTKENLDSIHLIAFYMLPVIIISVGIITVVLYKTS